MWCDGRRKERTTAGDGVAPRVRRRAGEGRPAEHATGAANDVARALRVLGRGLHDGGVLVAGNVVDGRGGAVRYTDVDVLQREGPLLRRCSRSGLGLGPVTDEPLRLTD
jgi:hypothetical protein